MKQKAGRITAAGDINKRIDDAYRAKYKGSPYLAPMIGNGARGATVRITLLDRNP
jgi:hypothetical protein